MCILLHIAWHIRIQCSSCHHVSNKAMSLQPCMQPCEGAASHCSVLQSTHVANQHAVSHYILACLACLLHLCCMALFVAVNHNQHLHTNGGCVVINMYENTCIWCFCLVSVAFLLCRILSCFLLSICPPFFALWPLSTPALPSILPPPPQRHRLCWL